MNIVNGWFAVKIQNNAIVEKELLIGMENCFGKVLGILPSGCFKHCNDEWEFVFDLKQWETIMAKKSGVDV